MINLTNFFIINLISLLFFYLLLIIMLLISKVKELIYYLKLIHLLF